MEENRTVVIGSFKSQNEAEPIIKRLKEEGYQREDITLYTSSDNIAALSKTQDVEVDTVTNIEQTAKREDDRSFWEQLKDKFTIKPYDYDDLIEGANYTRDTDLLYPYRDEIAAGSTVIVVENYRGEDDTSMI